MLPDELSRKKPGTYKQDRIFPAEIHGPKSFGDRFCAQSLSGKIAGEDPDPFRGIEFVFSQFALLDDGTELFRQRDRRMGDRVDRRIVRSRSHGPVDRQNAELRNIPRLDQRIAQHDPVVIQIKNK